MMVRKKNDLFAGKMFQTTLSRDIIVKIEATAWFKETSQSKIAVLALTEWIEKNGVDDEKIAKYIEFKKNQDAMAREIRDEVK